MNDIIERLRFAASAQRPLVHIDSLMVHGVALYSWLCDIDGQPPSEVVAFSAEARQCMENNLPYEHDGKDWRITYVDVSETEDFVIEGVEWT